MCIEINMFNANRRRYKWHCCLLLFGVTNNRVYNDAFRTFTFSMQQSESYTYQLPYDKTNQDNSFYFRFQIGNIRQSKRLLANLWRILLFHYYSFLYKNSNTGFSSKHLLRLQMFCMNSRYTRLVIGISRTVGSANKFVRIT